MKKIGFLTLLIVAIVLLTLALAAPASPKAAVAPTPAVAAVPAAPAAAEVPESHPHLTAAIEAMRNAKHELEIAEEECHGHRVKAINHLNQAINEAGMCERNEP